MKPLHEEPHRAWWRSALSVAFIGLAAWCVAVLAVAFVVVVARVALVVADALFGKMPVP